MSEQEDRTKLHDEEARQVAGGFTSTNSRSNPAECPYCHKTDTKVWDATHRFCNRCMVTYMA